MRRMDLTALSARASILVLCVAVLMQPARSSDAQSVPYERTFAQSKPAVEKALKQLQPSASGRLPELEGFALPGDRPLDRFQRGYYQCAIQVSSTPSGGALVRVRAKITAWYADSVSSNSGYQELASNGRLEADFLDRLEDALGGKTSFSTANPPASSAASQPKNKNVAPATSASTTGRGAPAVSTGSSKVPATPDTSPFKVGTAVNSDLVASLQTQRAVADKHMEELTKEAKGLEEILRNQAHPTNLVAVKKSGTPVLTNPIEGAKVLFLATAEDEFEILDMNASWVHVRISGLSRGWIRRSGVEMPKSFASDAKENHTASASSEHFQVKNEEMASFPGTWEPLRGKTVKILTVQNASGGASDTGSRAKLEFAKSLFEKEYAELAQSPNTAAGVVVIFDSEDGGMAAATLPALEQWKSGSLSDQAFWRRCFFDPPETFISRTGQ